MILDFDSTEASEGSVSVYNGHGDINSSHPAIRLACVRLAGFCWRASGWRVPPGDAFLFFILFMQHTQYTLLFFVHIAESQFFSKNLLTISEKYDII